MYKFIGISALVLIGYFLFIREASPEIIYFNGQEYGSRQLDRSNDSNSKIYNYYSKVVSNKDYISIVYPDSDTGSLSDWSNLFSKHFESQGFIFSANGENKTGIKNTVKVFMRPSQRHNVVFMYILENIQSSDHIDEDNIFTQLGAIVLE
jgi:hypothetical protein